MKKISFMIVAAGLLATSVITSCKKEAAQAPTTKTTTTNGSMFRMGGTWRAFQIDDDCLGYGVNCYELEPVVITSPKKALIAGAATSGNSSLVGTTFSSNDMQDFCDLMETNEVVKLQSGDYYITLNHDGNSLINYMAGKTFPVTTQNMEFAFQFTK